MWTTRLRCTEMLPQIFRKSSSPSFKLTKKKRFYSPTSNHMQKSHRGRWIETWRSLQKSICGYRPMTMLQSSALYICCKPHVIIQVENLYFIFNKIDANRNMFSYYYFQPIELLRNRSKNTNCPYPVILLINVLYKCIQKKRLFGSELSID